MIEHEKTILFKGFDINQFLILEKNLQNTINCRRSNW